MLVYKDIITGDELCSDSYPMVELDGVVMEVQGKFIKKEDSFVLDGANPSAEGEGEEGADALSAQMVVNVVDKHNLQVTTYDKKSYVAHIKAYMKALKDKLTETNPGRVDAFMKAAQEFVKKVIARFDDFEFMTGEQMNPDGMVVLKFYKEGATDPTFWFWKDGCVSEKY